MVVPTVSGTLVLQSGKSVTSPLDAGRVLPVATETDLAHPRSPMRQIR